MSGILLIDAEQPFADQLAGTLKTRGFSVKLLDDGKDGLDYARDHRPDLIVLCVELPKMSGYSICNKLKKDAELKGIPLVITSKEATPETFAQHKKLKTRAEDYLIKPFPDGELLDKIAALGVMPSGAGGASTAAQPPPPPDEEDALAALGAELDLDPPGAAQPAAFNLDDGDLAALDAGAAGSAQELGLGSDDDDLLASLDGGSSARSPTASPGGLDAEDDDLLAGLEAALDVKPAPPPPPAPAPAPAPAQRAAAPAPEPKPALKPDSKPPEPRSYSSPATSTPPTAAADAQQLDRLRRDNSDLKARLAELEARLKAAEEAAKSKDSQLAAASASAGGGSSAREVLNLKEQLRAKEKEIGILKDEVFEKEKAIVDLQEQLDVVRAEGAAKADGAKSKEVELATLQGKVRALTEERDELEEQMQSRLQQAHAERDQAVQAKSDLEGQVRILEDRAAKTQQRLKTEEIARDKARKALESAMAALAADGGASKALERDQLDAE